MTRAPTFAPERKWSGRAVTQARTWMAQSGRVFGQPCGQCGKEITTGQHWVIGHIKSRYEHPELTWVVSNWRPEHRGCSDRSSNEVIREAGRNDVRRSLGSSHSPDLAEAPALSVSPPGPLAQPVLSGFALPLPPNPTGAPVETRPDLAWDGEYVRSVPWLAEFADVPDDASPPLYMTRPPENAVGSYGAECIAEMEAELHITFRWWQRLALTLQLQHDAAGVLIVREFIESAPRRAGKSVRMRGGALWRLRHAEMFGETQLVMHTGSDIAICREIQRQAWRYAERTWGKKSVTQANGKEAIETYDGDRWLVRAQDAVYGYDVTLGIGDECWNVKPETFTEGIEPATLERSMPQVCLTSTAHRRATSLMRGKISTALAVYDPAVVLLLWGAPPGSDPSDPAVWRAASPHWSEDRHRLIARKYEAAMSGQADPQADDPDPMAGFTAQYLNVWRLNARAVQRGEPVTSPEAWADLEADAPELVAAALLGVRSVAIESWFNAGVSVARAWATEDGTVVVSVTDHPTVEAAAEHVRSLGYRGVVDVGKSLDGHPALKGIRLRAKALRAAEAVTGLAEILTAGRLRHDGGAHLTEQVENVHTLVGADGPRVVSSGRTDAIKAAVWAIGSARGHSTKGKIRVVLASEA